ncbi:hypothetical protein [Bradyrhizobium sp. RT3a]|uniref:hypothetical protein n=1 Tax=Bradyrhizobium sp. RT3a TaxID=3156333 RepID=UPI003394B227
MTIASATSRMSYVGNGSTTVFAIPYYFQQNSDIVVAVQDTNGTVTTKVLGTDYTLSGATLSAGGSCTFTTAPTSGYIIAIYRVPPLTQTLSLNNNDPLPADSLETEFDKTATIDQYLKSLIDRAILVAPTDTPPMSTLPPASVRALKNFTFDGSGNPAASLNTSGGAAVSAAMLPVVAGSTLTIARAAMGLNGYGMRDDGTLLYANQTITSISTNQAPTAASHNTRYTATTAVTFTLLKASTLWDGYSLWIDAAGGDVTVTPNASDNIDSYGAGVNFTVPLGARVRLTTDGAASGKWFVDGMPWLVQNPISCSGTRNITRADNGKILKHNSGAFGVFQFPAAANLPANFRCLIVNGETTPIGKGVGGTNLGSFRLYPGQAHLVINDNGTVRVVGGKQLYIVDTVQLYTDASSGSDDPLVADGLSTGARANRTLNATRNQLYRDFDHNGSQPICTHTGTFTESVTFGGQPINTGVFWWNGSSAGAFIWRPTNSGSPFCAIIGDGAVVEMGNVWTDGGGVVSVAFQLHQTAILDINAGCAFGSHGNPGGGHIATDGNGVTCNINASYALNGVGGASNHISTPSMAMVNIAGSITVTITNTPNMGTWFRQNTPSTISLGSGITFSGAIVAGCQKWAVGGPSFLSLSGNGANIPGSVAGSPAAGSAPTASTGFVVA